MAETRARSRVEEMDESFEHRARANGRTFEQEVEFLLERKQPLTSEERVAVSRYLLSRYKEIQPSMTFDEIREGLM
jgi:hypothetical protein